MYFWNKKTKKFGAIGYTHTYDEALAECNEADVDDGTEPVIDIYPVMRVLWYSRHWLTKKQRADLHHVYFGTDSLKLFSTTVQSWKEIAEAAADCDVIAVDEIDSVILSDLINPRNNLKPVIRAIPEGWERIVKIEVVTERLRLYPSEEL